MLTNTTFDFKLMLMSVFLLPSTVYLLNQVLLKRKSHLLEAEQHFR